MPNSSVMGVEMVDMDATYTELMIGPNAILSGCKSERWGRTADSQAFLSGRLAGRRNGDVPVGPWHVCVLSAGIEDTDAVTPYGRKKGNLTAM